MKLNIFQWRSLKTRVTLSMLAIFLLSIWSLTFYISRMLRDDMEHLLANQQSSTVSYVAAELNRHFEQRITALERVAASIDQSMLDHPAALQEMLERRLILQDLFNSGVVAVSLDGTAVADVPIVAGRRGTNYASNLATQAALTTGRSVVGQPVIGRVLRQPVFNINTAIRDGQGRVIGAMFGVINLAKPSFLDSIGEHPYGKSGGYLVMDLEHRLIVTATDKSRVMQPLPARGINVMTDRRVEGFLGSAVAVNSLGVDLLSSASPIPLANWLVIATLPAEEAFAPILSIQHRVLAATLFLTLLAACLTWWLLRRQLAPLLSASVKLAGMADQKHPLQPLPVTAQDEIGQLISGFNHLIETLGQNETALQVAKARAEQANHAKSRFLAAASHDLRQPLSALALYLGVLANVVTPETRSLVTKIQDCSDSLTELLTDLLDVSKLDAGVVSPKLSDFSVDDFLSSLVSMRSAEAAMKGLRLKLHRCGSAFAHTDQKLLTRIVGNLIDNAIHYTDKGGVLLACRRRAGTQWIEVWDTGVGIAPDKTELIFEEFTQLDNDGRNRGSGLGLAIVAKTAALLGLQIRVRSRPGRGSMFAIEMPTGRTILAHEPPLHQSAARRTRIGLVDDNAQVLEALVTALEAAGHEVIAAMTAGDLLERLGPQAPDIVISDYRLGAGETGFTAIQAARAKFGQTLPALIITGDTDPELVRSMAKRGIAIQYKPLKMDTLQAFIGKATERRST